MGGSRGVLGGSREGLGRDLEGSWECRGTFWEGHGAPWEGHGAIWEGLGEALGVQISSITVGPFYDARKFYCFGGSWGVSWGPIRDHTGFIVF